MNRGDFMQSAVAGALGPPFEVGAVSFVERKYFETKHAAGLV